jgi:hypothetical protein
MNDDDFENKLRVLTGALQRPDPTPAWKADILARARREADAIPLKRNLPPRWLMLGWAAAWTAILAMNLFTQRESSADLALSPRVSAPKQATPNIASPQGELPALIAFHHHLNLNLDLP